MATIYYDDSADLAHIQSKKVAVFGYGSQGHAHALNLKDSGVAVRVALPEGSRSRAKAQADGVTVTSGRDAAAWADVMMLLAPDTKQPSLYRDAVAPQLAAGKMLMFAHGFNIRFKTIQPPSNVDVTLIAPKAPGHRVREIYLGGGGTPAPACRRAGCHGAGEDAGALVREGARRYAGGGHRNHIYRRDRDRPVWRADGALRRGQRARQGGIRDARRGPATSLRSRTSSACTSSSSSSI